ncbi:LysR family transcriptional regulator [Pseudomonas sp. B6002]|uniref:LysR family transcriptional regulator n=1 Tax=Pseudomonas sp. B6002 TaxID=2726978 RepID=UPI0015A03390|nr:LysR family transcriptional regulator [Pseudomonas sp. B6002]NVZ50624.1 LysR family transcriptional regulator [Pseudomonas sp. B6002]
MVLDGVNDLIAFLTVARERSFTKAAAQMGVSQPALSRTLRKLEARLGVQLLTRSTRSVAPTDAGERLLESLGPHFDGIEAGLAELSELSGKPAGSLRITSLEHASATLLTPAVCGLMQDYPQISVEISDDYAMVDIVAERFDAGVRWGESVAKDMISVRIGPDFPMAVVGSPAYFERRPKPLTPHDLVAHTGINLRLPTSGGLWSWPFRKGKRELKVRPEGQVVGNSVALILDFALGGIGLAHLPEDVVAESVAEGKLVRVLEDWCTTVTGYHLYYPSRRQLKPAFRLLLERLRDQAAQTGMAHTERVNAARKPRP